MKNACYYLLEKLSETVREQNKIRSKSRWDCTAYLNDYGYIGLDSFINQVGQFYLYLAKPFVKSKSGNPPDWNLTQGSLNFTGIYLEAPNSSFGWGCPNGNPFLSNGKKNPLFAYKDDLYLFNLSKDLKQIELIVLPNKQPKKEIIFENYCTGMFQEHIQFLRQESRQFFDYGQN